MLAIVFVAFASYRTLFRVPRKNDTTALAFNKAREQKINLLAQKNNEKITKVAQERFGLQPAGNPFGTAAATAASASTAAAGGVGGAISASFVVVPGTGSPYDSGTETDALLKPQSVPIGRPVPLERV